MSTFWRLRPLEANDTEAVRAIFNHYVTHSFAAYREEPLTLEGIQSMLTQIAGYPSLAAVDANERLIGFSYLRAYSTHNTFSSTAMITYFIAPDRTGEGLGAAFLQRLEEEALQRGIVHLLAHISSKNEGSLRFHRTHGFEVCGTFHRIGLKQGESFDVVWVEKTLKPPR